jgi:putative transposase
MRQPLRFRGQLKQVTISKKAGKYFASFLIDTDDYVQEYPNRQESVGVDLGIKTLATLSNGEVFPNTRPLQRNFAKKENLTLADRIFSCDCGLVIDRDLNAAIMLNNYSS